MGLIRIESALPSVMHTAADIAVMTGADEAFIADKVGVRRRYVLGAGETGVGLAAAACRKLFDGGATTPDQVGVVVFVTQTPDRRLPQNSAGLCAALGLPTTVAAFDLALGCSGWVYGAHVLDAFLEATGRDVGLLVTCDPYSRIIAPEDRATNCVFGDAATVALWHRGMGGGRLGIADFGTDGEGGDALRIDGGGAAVPFVHMDDGGRTAALGRDDLRLHMAGREVFNFVLTRIPDSLTRCLEANGLTADEIDVFALHQGSLHMLQGLARRAGIPDPKLAVNIDRYGNTVSSTLPLLLEAPLNAGELAGRKVLVSGFGVGLSWATSVLTFDA
jgi:3-oxoacyl-[acyl-carrier-protein] synthase-3